MKNFRDATGNVIDWIDTRIETGFSNFLFIDNSYRCHPVLRRLFSLARKFEYKSLLIESITEAECGLLAEENAALLLRRPDFIKSTVHRLIFLRCSPGQDVHPQDFIGYVVFKSDAFASLASPKDHIYEAVLPPLRGPAENNFVHCQHAYTIKATVGDLTVKGVLYAQQNNATFVCAHVGLRTLASNLTPEGDLTYSQINSIVGVDHRSRQMGEGAGLWPHELELVLETLGLHVERIVHEPKKNFNLGIEYQRYLYGLIESGKPALVGFELDGGGRHVIPVIGHTFNDDAWVPPAQRDYFAGKIGYFGSESWLSSFLIHDDNFGPYYCLPRHYLKMDNFRVIVGVKPTKATSSALEIEAAGLDVLRALCSALPPLHLSWFDRLAVFTKANFLVLRTIAVTKADYMSRFTAMRDWEGNSHGSDIVSLMESHLPSQFWMVEASAPELFPTSRRKFGEVLLVSDAPLPQPLNLSALIAARLPGLIALQQGANLTLHPTDLKGHSPLFALEDTC